MDSPLVRGRPSIAYLLNRLRCLLISCAAFAVPMESPAQLVTPKTLPVLQSGQFDLFPSAHAGMAGATIALDDSLLDPFVNPAKASRIDAGSFFSAPYFHNVSGNRGGGRTLPVGASGTWGAWSATGLFTFQQLDRVRLAWDTPTSDQSAFNQYLAGSIA